jgi:hypothetical protein
MSDRNLGGGGIEISPSDQFNLQETNFKICSFGGSQLPAANTSDEVPPRGWVCEFGLGSSQ